jgi:hypothetical protein
VKNKDGQPEDISPLSRRFWGSGKWRGCGAALPRVNALKLLLQDQNVVVNPQQQTTKSAPLKHLVCDMEI